MRITKLSLTNFRSFSATQHIEFAPLTLLFGPNSVGKSSVLMALFYLQQLLDKGHCNPVRLDALGGKHVGGFRNLVNGRDVDKRIIIRLEADKRGEIGAAYAKIPDLVNEDFGLTVDSPTADADQLAVEFQVAWSKSLDTAYVACCTLWLDGKPIAELTSDAGLKQPLISWLNFYHPALRDDVEGSSDRDEDNPFPSRLHQLLLEAGYINPISVPVQQEQEHQLSDSDRDDVTLRYNELELELTKDRHLEDDEFAVKKFERHEAIGFRGVVGALPPLGQILDTVIDLGEPLLTARVHEILSDVIVAPLDNILTLLNNSLCIGPLRVIPDALHQLNPYPEQKDWYSGAAAWDLIGSSISQRDEINYWLNSRHTLDLGYSLLSKSEISKSSYIGGADSFRELLDIIDVFGGEGLQMTLSTEDINESPEAEQKSIDIDALRTFLQGKLEQESKPATDDNREVRHKTVLWDEVNGIEVSSADIGVGVSQVLPLVVAAVENRRGIIACEQPELHVHPRVQVGVGDLLTQCRQNSAYLIETHSEHLILRVLKRIRQSSDGELPEDFLAVSPDDVSIVYLEPFNSGVKCRRIHIDKDGEFVERWPSGFFSERAEELF